MLHRFRSEEPLYCLDYNLSGDTFAAGGKDPAITVFDELKKCEKVVLRAGARERAGHWNRVFALKFDPEAPHLLASAGWDTGCDVTRRRRRSH